MERTARNGANAASVTRITIDRLVVGGLTPTQQAEAGRGLHDALARSLSRAMHADTAAPTAMPSPRLRGRVHIPDDRRAFDAVADRVAALILASLRRE